jgi:hypothetical protein
MWFKVENKRSSTGQKFTVRCNSEIAGSAIIEERPVKGTAAARKTAEILASSLNVTATVFGADSAGEFVYGVYEVADVQHPPTVRSSSACLPNLQPPLCRSRINYSPRFLRTRSKALPRSRRRSDILSLSISRSSDRARPRSAIRRCFGSFAARENQPHSLFRAMTPPSRF